MDPALRELLQGVETEELEVILKLRHPQAVPPHVRLVARFGQVVTGRVERRWIREVWGHPDVLSFKAPRLLQAEAAIIDLEAASDVAWRDTDVRRPAGLEATGRGVVIGLVDVGCDFAHPHFRHADGSTRLLALWDQSKATSPQTTTPYGYGAIYPRDDINRALTQPQPYKALGYHPAQADSQGIGAHGTLVLDIAAGNGQTPGSPQGIAPQAELIFVHASTGVMGGLANLGDSVRILEALDFIARTARGRPWVVNVSMGRRGGSHDGLSLVEQGMDALLMQTPGSALVLSTGNYFSSRAHASGQLRPTQRRTLIWRTDKADITPNELEIWYSGKDAMTLEVGVPEKGPLFRAALAEDCPVLIGGRNVGHIYHRARDPNNGDNQINIFLRPEAPAGDWHVILIGEDIVDGIFHAWVERDAPCPHCDSRFEPQDVDPYCTTGTLCNGFRTIAAGAYDGHAPNRDIAAFSSCGPLRDFRQKPDLVAPGVQVLGARSAPWGEERQDSRLTRMSGTSFAAPHVTGTVALMFEAAGRPLAIPETHRLLLGSTRSIPAGKNEIVRLGSGYLDIERAVAAARRYKEEGLTPVADTRLPPPEQGAERLAAWPRAGFISMESTMTEDDMKPQEDAWREGSPPEEEPTEKVTKRFFLLISGGPGPYDDRDVEHDQSWANYVSPPLLLTDTSEKRKKFSEKDEEIWWLIYRPAYVCRWKDDFGNSSAKRQKAVKEVTDQGFSSYLNLLEDRAGNRGWNLQWLDDAGGFWKKLKTFPKGSISRLWYWGHARDDLWLSLGHMPDATGTAIAPEPHEIIQVADIDASLHERFRAGDAKRISRFVGCNTAAFAKAWAKAFKVWTEGVEDKVGFKSINTTGGEPCLVGSAAARVFKPGGAEESGATTSYQTCKDLGLGESLEFAEMEAAEKSPDTGFELREAEVGELGEPDDTGIEIEEPEEGSAGEFMQGEEELGQRLVEVADRLLSLEGSPGKPAAFLSRVLAEAGVQAFGDPLRPGVIRFPAPEVIWKAWKRPASTLWDYIEHFLEVVAGPGEPLAEALQTGDILVRVAPGEPGLGHLALIADPQLWGREELAAVGLIPEGPRPGRYVQVVEGGARPHGLSEGFARHLGDENGRLSRNTLILRIVRVDSTAGYMEDAPKTPPSPLSFKFDSKVIGKYKDENGTNRSTNCAIAVPSAAVNKKEIDLVVFFHGLDTCDPGHNFDANKVMKIFELDTQVDASKGEVALAAPALYWVTLKKDGSNEKEVDENKDNIKKAWSAAQLNAFVDEVLDKIGEKSSNRPSLRRLILAGHSRAYDLLTPLAKEFVSDGADTTKGALANLGKVLAMDTIYGLNHAEALKKWAEKLGGVKFLLVLSAKGYDPEKNDCKFKRSDPPVKYWDCAMQGVKLPGNLEVKKVSEKHCQLPNTYVKTVLPSQPGTSDPEWLGLERDWAPTRVFHFEEQAAPPPLCQEVTAALAQEKDRGTRVILQKLLELCQAVDRQDRTAIPKLLADFIKLVQDLTQRPFNVLSENLAMQLAIRLYLMGLKNESKILRRRAATFFAEEKPYLHTAGDKEAYITRDYEAQFWAEVVRQVLQGVRLTDVQAASQSLDKLLRLFADIRDVFAAYDPKYIREEAAAGFGMQSYVPTAYRVLLDQLKLLFTHVQRHLQFIMDAARADLEANKGFAVLEQLQQILETKVREAIFPQKHEQWVGGIEIEVTHSEFTKHGGVFLDIFLEGKAARERSVAFTFYNKEGEDGQEKTMSFERLNTIRLNQIKFLKRLYGVPGNVAENGAISPEGLENKKLISKMAGRRFRLDNDDDWREFLLLKFQAVRFKTRALTEGALLQIKDLLQAYLKAFTLHTNYNICDYCDAFCGSGPEKENYLNKKFPRALSGQLLHDCGVYALRAAYMLSLVRRDDDLLFNFVYLPAHVGLIILQVGQISAGKKQYVPFLILHNDAIFPVGDLIELARIRKTWTDFKMPGAAAKPLPIDDVQFLGELAAPAYIPGPVDMPFRLKDVPDDPKLTPTALKAKLWAFYKKEACIGLFGPEADDPKSEVYQIQLSYLQLIDDFKNLWNNQLRDFWNGQAHQAWQDVEAYVQHEAPQGKILAGEALALLKGYRQRLTKGYAPIVKGLNELEEKKKKLSALVEAHPKLKKTGIRFTFGQRAAIIRPPGLLDVFEEYQKYLKKLDDSLTRLEKQHQEILLGPILQALEPLFATEKGFLEPID